MMHFKFYVIHIALIIKYVLCVDQHMSQPRIYSYNGHLVIKAAKDKNISFVTNNLGSVRLNGVDLSRLAELTQNTTDKFEMYNYVIKTSLTKFNQFEQVLYGKNGLVHRMKFLENDAKTNSSTTTPYRNYRLNRRVSLLQRRMRALINLLTKNECASSPCKNGGKCQDLFNSFMCVCPGQWEGTLCDEDVNECARFVGTDLGCQNGATCINKPGTYQCFCPQGWFGIHCTQRKVDCSASKELCGNGVCVVQGNTHGYTCICDQGWTKGNSSPACIIDVDECALSHPACSVNPPVRCTNLPGSFHCGDCPIGYSGNGYHCHDVNECAIGNGGCSTDPLVMCINTPGSRICGYCPPGFSGNGEVCNYLGGACAVNNGGCHPIAHCTGNPRISSTYVTCICPKGYVGHGIGSDGCVKSSQPVNACEPNPCVNGICKITETGNFICACTGNYTGKICDKPIINICEQNPCRNGGTCVMAKTNFRCQCPKNFQGLFCESEMESCGGNLRGLNGVLKYPSTASKRYDQGVSCEWTIETTNSSLVLNVTFKKFSTEGSSDCKYDWLEIYDGRDHTNKIGRFCGTNLPQGGRIISTTNMLKLWFRSDRSVSSFGFELEWSSQIRNCTYKINVTSHGTIRSPGSPGNYPANIDCFWFLTAPSSKKIQFHFFSLMIGDSPDCNSDYLEFRETLPPRSTFAKYCNSSHPEPLISPASEAYIHFHSGNSSSFPGFQISYSLISGIPGCGGVYTKFKGIIHSPNVNGKYPPNILCEYEIKVNEGNRIKITFGSFALEQSTICKADYLAFYEGKPQEEKLLGKYCGKKIPGPIISNKNRIYIVFKSDWYANYGGFLLNYDTVCGGTFSEPQGIIAVDYSNYGEQCIFNIIQPMETAIILKFNYQGDSNSTRSICDYIEIRDGENENATKITNFCKNPFENIVSSFNHIVIIFRSSDFDYDFDFGNASFNYSTMNIGCGGIIKENKGTISSPSATSKDICFWVLSAPVGYVIKITWLTFQLIHTYACNGDYVEIFDNNTETQSSTSIDKYCGSILPSSLISSSNMLTIKLRKNIYVYTYSKKEAEFILFYTFIPDDNLCGGNFRTSAGVIKSPNFPNKYPPNRDCAWSITVKPGQQIRLNITHFNLEARTPCRYDFLEIRNGATVTSPLIGKYCGNKIDKVIPAHTNQVYLRFRSDLSIQDSGFKILWDSTTTGCGGKLTGHSGSIISPHYPEPYPKKQSCIWKITVSAGSVIQLIFTDLDLDTREHCLLSYVQIFDGRDEKAKPINRFCRMGNTPIILSNSSSVTVKFRSGPRIQGRGFNLQYNTVCKNTLKGFNGIIESPNFPNQYPSELNCEWNLEVPRGNNISITFSHFDLGVKQYFYQSNKNRSCLTDYIELLRLEQYSYSYNSISILCGTSIPASIIIPWNEVQVKFKSDKYNYGLGFRLEWQIVGCGGKLKHPTGTISTPYYPDKYTDSTVCDWIIETDYGKSIEITFSTLDLEFTGSCSLDYVAIYNGPDDTYPKIAQLCYSENPITINGTGNVMFVHFESDYNYKGKGFLATYTSVNSKCGGKIISIEGSIHSPNYPKNYDAGDTCEWLIEMEENYLIELEIKEVDFRKTRNCNKNYVKIYDGPSPAYPVLAKLCGHDKLNNSIKSTYNHLFVEMVTDTFISTKGFLAEYKKACGARIKTQGSGVIDFSTDTLLSDYENACSWTLIAERPDQHIYVTFTYIHSAEDCDYNSSYVAVYNGEDSDSPQIGQYCDKKIPGTLISSGNALHIYTISMTAIKLAYSVLETSCGGDFIAGEGEFATPRYPKTYPIDIECEWTIKASIGNTLSLTFDSMDIMQSDYCNDDYLEIRETNRSGNHLGTYCGSQIPNNITNVNSLWILFRSVARSSGEVVTTGKGFKAYYVLDHNREIFGTQGQLSSPLYPKYYQHYGIYNWLITVKTGYKIAIKFLDFYVDFSSDDTSCYFIYFIIYDGPDNTFPEIKTLCGFDIPESIVSTSNELYIEFNVNSPNRRAKFLLEWSEIKTSTAKNSVPKTPYVPGCGSKNIISLSKINFYNLNSPGYPKGYAKSLKCEWVFTTSPGNHLVLFLVNIDLQFNNMIVCYSDFITVYTGYEGTEDWKSLGSFCMPNDTYKSPLVASNFLKVKFETDYYFNKTGFAAVVAQECGGRIKDSNGVIFVDNSTYVYLPNDYLECEWNITVGMGKTIEIKFLKFKLKGTTNKPCENYILIKNGKYPDSPILGSGKYCGNELPPTLFTTGNHVYIKYRSTFELKEFELKFQESSVMCGKHIKLSMYDNSTTISSPNYPNIPPPNSECFWHISTDPGERLCLDFRDVFDFTESPECTEEYVEIRDGGTKFSPSLGKFCGEIPSSIFSTDNMLTVHFFTNIPDPKNGFKADISIAKCGGVVRSKFGVILSPHFNNKYMNLEGVNCTWHIIVPHDHRIIMHFATLDLPYSIKCSTNYVRLYEIIKINKTEQTLGYYCAGTQINEKIVSSNNEVIVNYVSRSSNYADFKGFRLVFNTSQEACGGDIKAPYGIIQSPGYPIMNHNNRECEWRIEVPKGRRVKLEFTDFDLDASTNIYDQGIAFFNEDKFRAGIELFKPGEKNMKIIRSSDNVLYVYFWSLHYSGHRGFNASFTSNEPSICVGDLNQKNSTIKQPAEDSYICNWMRNVNTHLNETTVFYIKASFNKTIRTKSCSYNSFLFISSDKEEELAEICISTGKYPKIVRSPLPITKLLVMNGKGHGKINFTVDYNTYPCGGILRNGEGEITSPNFPNKYGKTIDCAWQINLSPEQFIKLKFDTLKLGKDCTKSFITVYNGKLPTSPKIQTYCHQDEQLEIQSLTNHLFVEYHGDESAEGFKILYEPSVKACMGINPGGEKLLLTPSYPKSYPNNAECDWDIDVPEGFHIELKFERFQLEQSENCKNDFVETFNYIDDKWVTMGKICGRNNPPVINSISNKMRVIFRSNNQTTGSGFKAKWSRTCGGQFQPDKLKRYIFSPGFPDEYESNLHCVYKILSPNKFTNVVFEYFDIEKDNVGCKFDNVTMIQSINLEYNLKRTRVLCGNEIPPPIRFKGNLSIIFTTDFWVKKTGFKLYYQSDVCGGILNTPGEIKLPTYHDHRINKLTYAGALNCLWNITAPKNKNVVLKFKSFELEHNGNCYFDFLEIYNDFSMNKSSRLAKLCGNLNENLPVIQSKGNQMLIKIKTDFSKQFSGFDAVVYFTYGPSVGCGGNLNLTANETRIIQPPAELTAIDCHWEIFTPSDYYIKIEIQKASVKNCTCDCNLIEIKDGASSLGDLIEKICIPIDNKAYTTSNRFAWIRIMSLAALNKGDIKIKLTAEPSICGPHILTVTNQTKTLTSPNYPNPYPSNLKCSWLLTGEDMFQIKIYLKFPEFDLIDKNNTMACNEDRIEIISENIKNFALDALGSSSVFKGATIRTQYEESNVPVGTHQFCGKISKYFDYYSSSGDLTVKFYSYSKQHGKGFKMNYVLAGCNRNYTEIQGRIAEYKLTKECTIIIDVPEGRTISLFFIYFYMYSTGSCDESGLTIVDINNKKTLARVCGDSLPSPVFSFSNKVQLKVWNTKPRSRGSYDIVYTTTREGRGCGGFLYNYVGVISSPLYPDIYKQDSLCTWDIRVPEGLHAALKFKVFNVYSQCETNYVTIITYDGKNKRETQFCGNDMPAVFRSNNRITVTYTTSPENVGNWLAEFSAITSNSEIKW